MRTFIRIFPSSFIGLGFQGAEFLGVGFTVSPQDTILTTDSVSVNKSLHGPVYDTMSVTDAAVTTSATHGGRFGPGTAFTGIGTLGQGFTGLGPAATYAVITMSDRVVVTDAAVRSVTFSRQCTDTSSTTDAITYSVVLGRFCSDTIATSDSAGRVSDNVRPIADVIATADFAIGIPTVSVVCRDTILTQDTFAQAIVLHRFFGYVVVTASPLAALSITVAPLAEVSITVEGADV